MASVTDLPTQPLPLEYSRPGVATAMTRRVALWNLFCNLADGTFSSFAGSLLAPAFIVAPFLARLGASDTLIGVVTAAGPLLTAFVPILVARHVEAMPRKKPFVLVVGLIMRLQSFLIAGLILLTLTRFHVTGLFLILYVLLSIVFGIFSQGVMPAWTDLIAKVTPLNRRGLLFSWRASLGIIATLIAGGTVQWILNKAPFPGNFALLYLASGLAMMCSLCFIAFIRERGGASPPGVLSHAHFFSELIAIFEHDGNFSRFIASRALMAVANGIVGLFLVLTAQDRFGVRPEIVAVPYFLTMQVATFAGNLLFGQLGDRFGHKRNLILESPLFIAGCVLALLTRNHLEYGAVFVLLGLSQAARAASDLPIIMEFGGQRHRPRYVAVQLAIITPLTFAGAPLGGVLRDHLGLRPAFITAMALAVLAVTLLALVADPRKSTYSG